MGVRNNTLKPSSTKKLPDSTPLIQLPSGKLPAQARTDQSPPSQSQPQQLDPFLFTTKVRPEMVIPFLLSPKTQHGTANAWELPASITKELNATPTNNQLTVDRPASETRESATSEHDE